MSELLGAHDPPGSTPLEPEDLEALIPTFIATRSDLNVAEHANIAKAVERLLRSHAIAADHLLSIDFSDDVHRRMFGDVWRWAGTRRRRETNIGVDPAQIVTDVKNLFDNARYWHDNATYAPIEAAVRLHHRLAWIHAYPNGNGRHARLMADGYLHSLGQPTLSWGGGELIDDNELRRRYIAALHEADRGDLSALIDFAQS